LAKFDDKDDADDDDNEDVEYEEVDDAERIGECGGVVVVVVGPLEEMLFVVIVAPLTVPVELSFRWCLMIF